MTAERSSPSSSPSSSPGIEGGPALEIRDLTVRYFGRDTDALAGVTVSVAPGELVGMTGRTGAGKSTLALAAAGLIPRVVRAQVDGEVRVMGQAHAAHDGGARFHVGIVFPNPHNQISATKTSVREELAFGLENLGVPRGEMDARIDAVLEALRIAHLADRFPVSLSGGEQQRVAIASVLVMGGPVLVLDEPTAQLDPAATELVAEVLAELAARGHAILVADHDEAVLGRTERVIVLDGGQVVASAAPGIALAATVLGPLGLSEPDVVRLAAAANVPPPQALDENVVTAGLELALAARSTGPVPQPQTPPSLLHVAVEAGPTWSPVRTVPAPALEVRELLHRYRNGIEAVRTVSLRIEPGETVAIVGQNGSGKTTLVKHLNGLLRPTAGSVHHDGRDIGNHPVHELAGTVGFVFQNPDDQVFNRTVERELAFGPRNLKVERELIEDLVRHALEVTGLESVRGANPYDLGTSERKLVALAGILAMDPPVLVLDEPTTGQDGPGVARVGRVVDAWAGAGRTVVAITHDMAFAARHFGRIIVMRLGEVVADGPPTEVFARDRVELLASTGLRPPAAVRIAHRLGLDGIVGVDDLLDRVFGPPVRDGGTGRR